MQNPPAPNPVPNNDRQHLKLLATFHYVYAGLTAVFTLLSLGYFWLMWVFITSPTMGTPTASSVDFGWFMAFIAVFSSVYSILMIVGLIIAGRCLNRRIGYWFTFIVAVVECLSPPIGTALGIFTIVVLLRDSVKVLYGLKEPLEQP